jgi:hypothetical protein
MATPRPLVEDSPDPGEPYTTERAPEGFQTPPHDTVLEAKLLGVLMVRNAALAAVRDRLRPEHFYEPNHAGFYKKIRGRILDGRLADENALSIGLDLAGREHISRVAQLALGTDNEEVELIVNELIALWQRREQAAIARDLASTAYDFNIHASEWRKSLMERLTALDAQSPQRPIHVCDLPALDLLRVANEEPPPERWLVTNWLPVGTTGLLGGMGSSGKSFLELIRLVCLAAGRKCLGYDLEQGPINCLGYFSEDSSDRIWRRVRQICASLQVDPALVAPHLQLVSTVGAHRHMLEAEPNASKTRPTDWLHHVHDRVRAGSIRYVTFDHVGRYWAVNRNDPNQVFSAFSHLDEFASSIDGTVCLLAHPSKSDIRAKNFQGGKPQSNSLAQIGGCAAMFDAPRWVHILTDVKVDGEKFRVLTYDKANYGSRFAIKLVEDTHRVANFVGEVDPDNPTAVDSVSEKKGSRGRPSGADRTFLALEELVATFHRSIPIDELVHDCIRRGIVAEADENSGSWRDRRRTMRQHLSHFTKQVEARDDDTFMLKP